MSIQNLATRDPFADLGGDKPAGDNASARAPKYIHIRLQQRNGRKSLTTIQGVPDKYDHKKILKHCKKEFACNGTLVEDAEMGKVIQLQGDQREKAKKELQGPIEIKSITIMVHGA